jgi:myo-inositol-1(or 4)-monophosphatase
MLLGRVAVGCLAIAHLLILPYPEPMDRLTEIELRRLLDGAIEVTRSAAVPVMQMFRRQPVTWSKDDDGNKTLVMPGAERVKNPVTEADLAADRVLREGLLPLLEGSAWLSEESVDDPCRLEADRVWIVDPIDGTREYVNGVPEFAISVALVESSIPVLAVLYNPAEDILFTALRGLGCWRNGIPTSLHCVESLGEATLLASRTETGRGEFSAFSDRMQVRSLGSTAWKLALVAGGEAQAYFTRKPRNEWDIAAGVLLCAEAGATVTDLGGDLHVFNRPDPLCRGVVTAQPDLHPAILEMIYEVGTLE